MLKHAETMSLTLHVFPPIQRLLDIATGSLYQEIQHSSWKKNEKSD
jgi:hypothetical protein